MLEELIEKAAARIRNESGFIQVVSHYDADGIASAAIIKKSLVKLEKNFNIKIVKQIKPELIDELNEIKADLIIFSDLGSGYMEEIIKLNTDVIISDHHEITGNIAADNIIHVNPMMFESDYYSASYVTSMIAKKLGTDEVDALALVGAIGDSSNASIEKLLESEEIVQERGLKLFGRMSRPIHKALELSFDAEIPGVTGSESSAIQFLSEVGINPKNGEKWRTLSDLENDEVKTLAAAIIKERIKNGHESADDIFGYVWTLKNFEDELRDATEFATLLNCCGRLGDPQIGIDICLGKKDALEKVRELVKKYKRNIGKYLSWLKNHPEIIIHGNKAVYILAENKIHENFIGTIVSISARSMFTEGIVIGMADSEDGVKVSGRSMAVNINEVLTEAAGEVDGVSGGHCEAAGAVIPKGSEDNFIKACEEAIKKHL